MGHTTSLKCRLGARACLLIEFCNFCSSSESAHPFRPFKHVKLCLSPSNYLQSHGTAPAALWPWEELWGKCLLKMTSWWPRRSTEAEVWLKIEIALRMRTENIPVADCSPCGNLSICFQLKSPQMSLVPITPRLSHVTPCKGEISIFVATL